jgi:orotate phosphoribosyltransferase
VPDYTDSTLNAFRETGAYLNGHFRLTSGLHSSEYLQCAKVLQYPERAERFGALLRDELQALLGVQPVNAVCSPAMGGLMIGHEVARAFGVRHIFTEREEGRMTLRRGFSVEAGENIIVVEDVVTTGGSTREVIELLRSRGANVLAACSIIDRSNGKAEVGAPRVALAKMEVVAWEPAACPLCAQGLLVVKPGSRPTPA